MFRQSLLALKNAAFCVRTEKVHPESKPPVQSSQGEKDEHERPLYANYAEFILSCIGYSVGLGNIWRFPHLAYANGGGAFLIPYWISVIIAGLPFYFLELALGQYSSLGPNCIFIKLAPIAQGLGWAMCVVAMLVSLYYNVIVAWVLFYFFYSLRTELPWSNCRHDYNTERCYSKLEDEHCKNTLNDTGARFYNKTCWSKENVTAFGIWGQENVTAFQENVTVFGINVTLKSIKKVAPADEFFNRFMLNASDSFEDIGTLQWQMVVALAVAWLLVFVCLYKGIQSAGKAVYVTATFPYVVLVILLVRGATLPGAREGILFYVTPQFSKITTIDPWIKAATQVFYSLGPAFGGIITMASYMPFRNNCQRDAIIVSLVDSFTSMLAGCAIFSILGFMAQDLGVAVENVTKAGPGLAFIAYPEAIVRMPLSPLWSALFFIMMILLGLDSEFSQLEVCTTCVIDQFPKLRPYKTLVIFLTCLASFLIGLIFVTNGGIYYFTAFDDYSAGYCVLVIAICECIVVCYFYGIRKFMQDVCSMLGWKPNYYWIFMWCIGAPLYMSIVLIFTFISYTPSEYGNYIFTYGAEAFGWILSLLSIVCIPAFAIGQLIYIICIKKQNWRSLFKTSPDWCPASERSKNKIENFTLNTVSANSFSSPPPYYSEPTRGSVA